MPRAAGDETSAPAWLRGGQCRWSVTSFVLTDALHELGVGLVRGNFWLYCAGMLARASGSSFRPGLRQPMDDSVVV
jgi:hypothetical protein